MVSRTVPASAAFLLLFLSSLAHAQTATCTGWHEFDRVDGREETIGRGITNFGIVVGGTYSGYNVTKPPAFIRYPDGNIVHFRYQGFQTTFSRRNSQDVTIGYYTGPGGHTHGIVKYGSKVVTFNHPNASDTVPLGINKWGTIVGYYQLPGSIQTHGFEYKNGQFHSVQFPGATGTRVQSINDNGVMVGDYSTVNNGADGFMLKNGVFTKIKNPKATGATEPQDINNAGMIVGDYVIGVIPHSFMYSNGVFKDINVPNTKVYAQVHGINDHNDVTGEVFTSTDGAAFIGHHCQ